MILQLSVKGLAVVGNVTMNFEPGFSVITGETGAGKTMLVHAIDLLRGSKPDFGRIAKDASELCIEAIFRLPAPDSHPELWTRLDELSANVDEGELIVSRTVRPTGRSSASVGGRAAPLAALAEVTDEVLALHGQHSARLLTRSENHRRLLDSSAGIDLRNLLDNYRAAYRRLADIQNQINHATQSRDQEAIVVDALTRLVTDFDASGLFKGEDAELRNRSQVLNHILSQQTSILEALALLSNDVDSGAVDVLSRVQRLLGSSTRSEADAGATSDAANITRATELIESAARDLNEAVALLVVSVEGADERARDLEQVNLRRSEIAALVRRHAALDADDLCSRAEAARKQLELTAPMDLDALESERLMLAAEVARLADLITVGRKSAATAMTQSVNAVLSELGFGETSFHVQVEDTTLALHGHDAVDFRLVTRSGGAPVSLTTGASGGEMSRVALAITAVTAAAEELPALVFDEVDAGIGGNTANAVGRCLADMSNSTQIIAVTHLPQVAAMASQHWVVAATETGAAIVEVNGDSRVDEMCRMLGVDKADSAARTVAQGLLARTSPAALG